DLERLLAGVRLRDQEIIDVHADLLGVDRIERMLRVDERSRAALLLDLGDDLQRERGLARRLWPVDLDDAPARQPADAERKVEPERAGRHDLDVARRDGIPEPHHRTLAELLFDLAKRCRKGLLAVLVHSIFLQGCEWSAALGRRRQCADYFTDYRRRQPVFSSRNAGIYACARATAASAAAARNARCDASARIPRA